MILFDPGYFDAASEKVRQRVPHPNTALTWPSYRTHFLSGTTILKSHSRKTPQKYVVNSKCSNFITI